MSSNLCQCQPLITKSFQSPNKNKKGNPYCNQGLIDPIDPNIFFKKSQNKKDQLLNKPKQHSNHNQSAAKSHEPYTLTSKNSKQQKSLQMTQLSQQLKKGNLIFKTSHHHQSYPIQNQYKQNISASNRERMKPTFEKNNQFLIHQKLNDLGQMESSHSNKFPSLKKPSLVMDQLGTTLNNFKKRTPQDQQQQQFLQFNQQQQYQYQKDKLTKEIQVIMLSDQRQFQKNNFESVMNNQDKSNKSSFVQSMNRVKLNSRSLIEIQQPIQKTAITENYQESSNYSLSDQQQSIFQQGDKLQKSQLLPIDKTEISILNPAYLPIHKQKSKSYRNDNKNKKKQLIRLKEPIQQFEPMNFRTEASKRISQDLMNKNKSKHLTNGTNLKQHYQKANLKSLDTGLQKDMSAQRGTSPYKDIDKSMKSVNPRSNSRLSQHQQQQSNKYQFRLKPSDKLGDFKDNQEQNYDFQDQYLFSRADRKPEAERGRLQNKTSANSELDLTILKQNLHSNLKELKTEKYFLQKKKGSSELNKNQAEDSGVSYSNKSANQDYKNKRFDRSSFLQDQSQDRSDQVFLQDNLNKIKSQRFRNAPYERYIQQMNQSQQGQLKSDTSNNLYNIERLQNAQRRKEGQQPIQESYALKKNNLSFSDQNYAARHQSQLHHDIFQKNKLNNVNIVNNINSQLGKEYQMMRPLFQSQDYYLKQNEHYNQIYRDGNSQASQQSQAANQDSYYLKYKSQVFETVKKQLQQKQGLQINNIGKMNQQFEVYQPDFQNQKKQRMSLSQTCKADNDFDARSHKANKERSLRNPQDNKMGDIEEAYQEFEEEFQSKEHGLLQPVQSLEYQYQKPQFSEKERFRCQDMMSLRQLRESNNKRLKNIGLEEWNQPSDDILFEDIALFQEQLPE